MAPAAIWPSTLGQFALDNELERKGNARSPLQGSKRGKSALGCRSAWCGCKPPDYSPSINCLDPTVS
jgi:hypothetical protein